VARLNAGIASTLATQEVVSRMNSLGITVTTTSPEQFGALMRAEHEKFERLVRQSGARND
jgi:tripartite-type tricarboxylate transporter receptor subunit TctC